MLDALDVALVCVLAHRADRDDVVGAQHLELEVGVVGDHHELGIAWSPENRMVVHREPDHVKSENLPSKVLASPKVDGQVDLPKGVGSVPRNHVMKWQGVGSQVRPTDPHEGQGLGVEDVEVAASIH